MPRTAMPRTAMPRTAASRTAPSCPRPLVSRLLPFALVSLFASLTATSLAAEDVTPAALVPPPVDLPVQVSVDLYSLEVFDIDEKQQVFHVGGRIDLSWFDPRQAFEPETVGAWRKEFQGQGALEALDRTVWWPDFEIVDSVESRDRMHVNLTIDSDGEVFYRERFTARIKQDFLLDEFPFDAHAISFAVEPFTYSASVVQFVANPDSNRTTTWKPTEWYVSAPLLQVFHRTEHVCFDADGEAVTQPAEGPCGNQPTCPAGSTCGDVHSGFSNAQVSFEIERESGSYTGNIILPLLLIVLISTAVFWMDLEQTHLGDRLSVSFTALLTVVAFDFVTSDSLPKLSYSTAMDRIVTASYFFLALTIFANVAADLLHQRGEQGPARAQRLNRRLAWLAPALFLFTVLVLTI